MDPSTALSLAKKGNPSAIAQLLNHHLNRKGIVVQVTREHHNLLITLEAAYVPNRTLLLPFLWRTLTRLEAATIQNATIQGKRLNCCHVAWFEELPLLNS